MFLELHGKVKLREGFQPDYEIKEKMKDTMGWLGCGEWEERKGRWILSVDYIACCSPIINPKLYEMGIDVPLNEPIDPLEFMLYSKLYAQSKGEV